MFDANASHIKCGELFFAEIHAVDEQLDGMGVKCGDIVMCKHITKSGDRLRTNELSAIYTSINEPPTAWKFDERSDDWAWMVYSGRPNGNGFINDKWKNKALGFLGGKWILD